MAETVAETSKEEQKLPTGSSELMMDGTLAVNRFLYIEEVFNHFTNDQSKFVFMSLMNVLDIQVKEYIRKLVESDPLAPINLMKKAVQSKSLYSHNSVLWCAAYCLCELRNEDLRKEIRKNFAEIIQTPEHLLKFMFAYQHMKGGKMNFGRGMRNALQKWYGSKSVAELFDILYSSKKYRNVDHKTILHQLHLKLDDREKNKVLHSMYKNYKDSNDTSELTSTDKMIASFRKLKRCADVKDVIEILKAKQYAYKLQHIPSFAMKSHEVIDLILPNLSLREVLDNLLTFCSFKMLKVHEPISKKICNGLHATNKQINEAKLHPLNVFVIMKVLEKRLTINQDATFKNENGSSSTTADANANPIEEKSKEKKISNPFIIKKLQQIFTQSMNDQQPKTGCRFFVTVNFRHFSNRQSKVHGLNSVMCSELQAIIGLTLLKNEKEVTIMSFTDDEKKLKLVDWNNETSYEKAMEIYEKEINENKKTREIIVLPLKKAIEDKKKVDVFITFVSSLGRTMGNQGKPDKLYAELQNYKKAMGLKMTKYIIVNMTRKSPDIKYDGKSINEKGILEIVGFSENALKVVEAFSKNCFA